MDTCNTVNMCFWYKFRLLSDRLVSYYYTINLDSDSRYFLEK
jgi:hypothetical protein